MDVTWDLHLFFYIDRDLKNLNKEWKKMDNCSIIFI